MTNNLKRQSMLVRDLAELQITGSNRPQPRSGMWKVNNINENESRPEVVRLFPGSSFSLLKSDFGFKRGRTDTFEGGLLQQSRHGFHIENDYLEERFRQVASRHLETLQTSGCRLSTSEADSAIGRLRTVLCPARVKGTGGKSVDRRLMPCKAEQSERKSDTSIESDQKRKAFISATSGFKNNFQHQQIKRDFNFAVDCEHQKSRQQLNINGMNIGKKKIFA